MHILVAFIVLTSLIAGFQPVFEHPEEQSYVVLDAEGQVMVSSYKESAQELESKHIVMQELDYSCGAAALATLLNYHLGEQLTEEQVIHGLFNYGDVQAIQERRAFSMLDMKRFVDALGYDGQGYRAEMEDLEDLEAPVVLPIELYGYQHFVVYRGMHDGRVFLADPWMGHTIYSKKAFQEMWYKQVLFMVDPGERQTVSLLRLSREDLRYVHTDLERWWLFPPEPSRLPVPAFREHKRLDGEWETYKR
ncbi:MAG: C39 family peptidase [Desulfohalobiaceae bacterium]